MMAGAAGGAVALVVIAVVAVVLVRRRRSGSGEGYHPTFRPQVDPATGMDHVAAVAVVAASSETCNPTASTEGPSDGMEMSGPTGVTVGSQVNSPAEIVHMGGVHVYGLGGLIPTLRLSQAQARSQQQQINTQAQAMRAQAAIDLQMQTQRAYGDASTYSARMPATARSDGPLLTTRGAVATTGNNDQRPSLQVPPSVDHSGHRGFDAV